MNDSNKYYVIVLLLSIFLTILSCTGAKSALQVMRDKEAITQVVMKISSENGLKNIIITEPKILDSLTSALREAEEIQVQSGGLHKIWADVTIHKKKSKANFMVTFSEYHGWMVYVNNKTLKCEYIFNLIKAYNDKK